MKKDHTTGAIQSLNVVLCIKLLKTQLLKNLGLRKEALSSFWASNLDIFQNVLIFSTWNLCGGIKAEIRDIGELHVPCGVVRGAGVGVLVPPLPLLQLVLYNIWTRKGIINLKKLPKKTRI
jgi:hypothetical protein